MVLQVHSALPDTVREMFLLAVFRDKGNCPEFRTKDGFVMGSAALVLICLHVPRCAVTM